MKHTLVINSKKERNYPRNSPFVSDEGHYTIRLMGRWPIWYQSCRICSISFANDKFGETDESSREDSSKLNVTDTSQSEALYRRASDCLGLPDGFFFLVTLLTTFSWKQSNSSCRKYNSCQ